MEGMEKQQEDSKQHNLILIYYISINGIRSADLEEFIDKIKSKIILSTIEAEFIIIPVDGETRIECINPVYITNGDLIKKHERLMSELHEHLNNELKK